MTSSPWAGTRCWRCGWSAGSARCWAPSWRSGRLFEAPTPAALAARLARPGRPRAALAAQARPERVPLSFAQQRLWFLAQLEGPAAVYNIPLALRLDRDLDVRRAGGGAGDVIARHEVLRTVFPAADGQPYQQDPATAELGWRLPVIREVAEEDLRAAGGAGAPRQPFDLAAEVPVRARLLTARRRRARAGGGDAPHRRRRLVDGPAGPGPGHRLRGAAAGQAPGWAPLPVQYADYAIWQRELLGDRRRPGQPAVPAGRPAGGRRWPGAPEELALPADRPRPAVPSHRGMAVPLRGPGRRCMPGWRRLAREQGVTLFMVVQAALAVLLSRLGAGDDIPVGTRWRAGPMRRWMTWSGSS